MVRFDLFLLIDDRGSVIRLLLRGWHLSKGAWFNRFTLERGRSTARCEQKAKRWLVVNPLYERAARRGL